MNASRRFLQRVLAAGLECGEITAAGVIARAGPEVLARHLPVEVKARLLGASLGARKMSPALVVEVVGADGFAEHLPVEVLWAVVEDAVAGVRGVRAEGQAPAPDAKPEEARSEARDSRSAAAGGGAAGASATGASAAVETAPRKPNRIARPRRRDSIGGLLPETALPIGSEDPALERRAGSETDIEHALDELVVEEPEFDVDTKVGGNRAPPGEWSEDDTNPGKELRRS